MTNILKLFALEYVKIQDTLTGDHKLSLGKFIMESNDVEIEYMLATGEPKAGVTEEEFNLLIESFASGLSSHLPFKQQVDYFLQTGTIPDDWRVAGLALAAIAATAAAIKYKTKNAEAARICGKGNYKCMAKVKQQAVQAKVSVLQKGFNACNKSKDPVKCKAKIKEKIQKAKAKG